MSHVRGALPNCGSYGPGRTQGSVAIQIEFSVPQAARVGLFGAEQNRGYRDVRVAGPNREYGVMLVSTRF